MLIRFSSDAYESIVFFGEVAQKLLSLMGHSGAVPGAIKAEDVPKALENLESGIGQAPCVQKKLDNDEDEQNEISISHRAVPLIQMLKAAREKKSDILWQYV